ncbi:rRNA maturation RNase YbeY [Flavobacterium branchiophilum]|uniref:Endoribonuclease YbeY n=1 Tax=Flavobacterium branchiophilum TaxID=55197 RepID=A0A2H3KF33_9FLAO|nr:rRNA maturation RNase YbeY [Flavobacterium branchiophilum]PDS27060.1 rRNA maturation RNase YbeY [Flavobacterium branchiophilum]
MIEFNYETDFSLENETAISQWITQVIESENKTLGEINFIFCDDEYLLDINITHLQHDYYTDIISFDYTLGNEIAGDFFISIDRVRENALEYLETLANELNRVMVHGILHCCGYNDKSPEDEVIMRSKEDEKLALFHVEQ